MLMPGRDRPGNRGVEPRRVPSGDVPTSEQARGLAGRAADRPGTETPRW